MSEFQPISSEADKTDLYVDETGDVKSYRAQNGVATESLEKTSGPDQVVEESEELVPEEVNPTQAMVADRQLEGTRDLLSNLGLVGAQIDLPLESRTIIFAMTESLEKEAAELRQRFLKGEDVSEEIASLNQRINNQIGLGKSEVYEAKQAKIKEEMRQGAEVAGRTAVANYEIRTASEPAREIINPESEAASVNAVQPTTDEVSEETRKISRGERELGAKYGRAAIYMQELLDSSSYKGLDDDPRVTGLKGKIKQYLDLSQLQLNGAGHKPGFRGMREIDGTIQELQDALFVRQQDKVPSSDKKSKRRLVKIAKSKNTYEKFI